MHTLHGWFKQLPVLLPSVRTGFLSLFQSLRWPSARARLVCIVVLLASVAVLSHIKARQRTVLLDFGATNGTFQNYNPLRRLDAGQVMFRDFYPYLGIGPTLTSYAALRLEGNDFRSSVYALETLAGVLHIAALLLLARLCRLSWFWSCAVTAGLLIIGARFCPTIEQAYAPRTDHWPATIHGLFFMFQSAIAVRAAAPILLCLYVLLRPRVESPAMSGWLHWLLDGVPAGLALMWSNDYGLPTFAAYSVLFGLLAPSLSWRQRGQRFAGIVVVAALTALIALTAVTGGRPWSWLQYNAGVAADQFWYYEGRKILRLTEVPVPASVCAGIATALFLAVDLYRRPQALGTRCLLFLLLAQLAAGYLSSVGGHFESHYFLAFQRTLTFAAPYAVVRMFAAVTVCVPDLRRIGSRLLGWWRASGRIRTALAIVQILLAYFAAHETGRIYGDHKRHDRSPQHALYVPEMGGRLSEPWSKMVALAREIRNEPPRPDEKCRLFSTYATGFEPITGEFQPTGHDYIIHALGEQERQRYLQALNELQPARVVTLRRDACRWEGWVRSMHWDFYRELFRHYEPCDRSICHVVWQRREQPRAFPDVPVSVREERLSPAEIMVAVDLPADSVNGDEAHYVEIEVDAAAAWRSAPLINGSWRQRIAVLDPTKDKRCFPDRFAIPSGRRWCFPMLVRPGQTAQLVLTLCPEEHGYLELRHLAARYVLPSSEVDDFPLARLHAACVDSGPWRRGIQQVDGERSIVCVSDPTDLKHLRSGQYLRFAGSGLREITKIDHNHVYIAGPPLDPDRDGYPASIRVVPVP